MKRTKIVCTIGPASEKLPVMKAMLKAGMNVARLNFSHGTYEHHAMLIKNLRRAAKETGLPVAILQDLQGPRIRIGDLPKEGVSIKRGETVALVPERSEVSPPLEVRPRSIKVLPQQYKGLARDVKKGTPILIADGAMKLMVKRVHGDTIVAKVVVGGVIKAHKGINVPGVSLGAKPITAKDKKDLAFGLQQGVDFVTLSFVKDAKDIVALQKLIKYSLSLQERAGVRSKYLPKVVAKVERPEAVANIERIVAVSDAVMIGRGDLALEADPAKLAIMQKDIVAACLRAGKPVIVATQMLESMMGSPRPTRAEISDVSNAVIDHTDATMLSGETAGGQYPVEVVRTMADVITQTEMSKYDDLPEDVLPEHPTPIERLAHVVAENIHQFGMHAVVLLPDALPLLPGLLRHRPETRIVPVVHDAATARPLLLQWGTYPIIATRRASSGAVLHMVRQANSFPRTAKIILVTRLPKNDTLDGCVTFVSL